MANFDAAFDKLVELEGGYSPMDTPAAGEVKYGLTYRFLRSIGYPAMPRDVTLEEARNIYLEHFWKPMGLDLLDNQRVAEALFVQGVNGGPERAVKYAAEVLRAMGVDGAPDPEKVTRVGRKLARALSYAETVTFIRLYRERWKKRYREIIDASPAYRKYYRGWMARLDSL